VKLLFLFEIIISKGSSRARYVEVGIDQKGDNFDEALYKRRMERKKNGQKYREHENRNDILECLSTPENVNTTNRRSENLGRSSNELTQPKSHQVLFDDNLMELTRGRFKFF
jgi:hypothetical protein